MNGYRTVLTLGLLTSVLTSSVSALDRRAQSIESVAFEAASYSDLDDIGVAIHAETPVADTGGDWALVARIGAGQLTQSVGPSFDRFDIGLGLKHYIAKTTSLSLQGGYAWYRDDDHFEIGAITLSGRQFLRDPTTPVAPYVRLNGDLQFVSPSLQSPARHTGSYRMAVIEALAGCEIRMSKALAFVVEAGVSQSTALSSHGRDLADGWLGGIAMQYDWF